MSEEMLQRNLKEKIGTWDFYNIGSTTINQLKKWGILRAVDYEDIGGKKVDTIIMENKRVIAIIEFKSPKNFNTQNKKNQAVQQEIEVAKKLKSNEEGNELKYPFDEKDPNLQKFIDETLVSIDEKNDKKLPKQLVDPTDLAKQYHKNSSSNDVLDNYARTIRPKIKELFPEGSDGTTIINGTIFVNKKQKAVTGYGTVFKKVLERFKKNGKLEKQKINDLIISIGEEKINSSQKITIGEIFDLSIRTNEYAVEKELLKQEFGFSNKAGKDKVKDIEIKIPTNPEGGFDLLRQEEIAKKYKQIEEIKEKIKAELEKIENIKVDIGI
ncbi:6939_t:CDS:2 [Ambispora leptoticha]|uniref:6939_t:CDS:1 n=1 Tax=Ambispora leptoticha TaxID=144679 RepID=A0A9N8YLM9_9GLOM|nr:6939_t:CDS:2 [Ambispora leptoticha]